MKHTQLLKGVLEGCVLSIISKEEIYGYELVQKLRKKGFKKIVGGTIYPLLQKLEKQGFIKSRILPSSEGPNRHYFSLTKIGKARLSGFKKQWRELAQKVEPILEESNENKGIN
ncbi:MAG: PadR family transcriptional regulator [Lactobacillales bacterium]|jgi:PadR family transcriptional regulator PadR|nr:PadR family transcriptional regulator [Lactobacillales bacterium]